MFCLELLFSSTIVEILRKLNQSSMPHALILTRLISSRILLARITRPIMPFHNSPRIFECVVSLDCQRSYHLVNDRINILALQQFLSIR